MRLHLAIIFKISISLSKVAVLWKYKIGTGLENCNFLYTEDEDQKNIFTKNSLHIKKIED